MKRRDFIKNSSIAGGTLIMMPAFAGNLSSLKDLKLDIPSVRLTQQDFVSTFPWGIRGDKVRILQQEVENELLDTETLAAIAFMLGAESASSRLDEAWKLMLNSQNHDIHVCLYDETGIDWCNESRLIAKDLREKAREYIGGKIGGPAVALNTLSWSQKAQAGQTMIPGFGYAVTAAENKNRNDEQKNTPWKGWFETESYKIRLLENGSIETLIGKSPENRSVLGYLTLFSNGKTFDTRTEKPKRLLAWLSPDRKKAFAEIEGKINGIAFIHKIVANSDCIDYQTTLDYGTGLNFGPEIEDFEEEPRRTHYYQHERKLCMNCEIPTTKTRLIYNSPFLTWPSDKSKSVESLHFTAIESKQGGIAHFNIGQSGYGYDEKDSVLRHVLAFAPKKYVYDNDGKFQEKLILKGKQTHHYQFVPYLSDWRKSRLPMLTNEFQHPVLVGQTDKKRSELPEKGSFLQIGSNTTMATALFERGGNLYVRLWEWAGQKDTVSLQFGDTDSSLLECTHDLKKIGKLDKSFSMHPWEIKTIQLLGSPKIIKDTNRCSRAQTFISEPEGWAQKNYFVNTNPPSAVSPGKATNDGLIYFSSGFHDGFVKPMEKHSETMSIEMQRVRSDKYPNYTSTWELGGSCWVAMNEHDPEYLETLKPYIKEGSIEIVGGTWCEPYCLIIGGESIMRQFMYGLEAIETFLDTKIKIYSNQEHATFAQMPQILKSFGIKAAVNRTQWAPFGYESGLDAEVAEWIGVDGSKIIVIPRYNYMHYLNDTNSNKQHGSITGHGRMWRSEEKFKEMRDMAVERGINRPLMTMLEDIWAEYLRSSDAEMNLYASLPFVRFTSIERYLEILGIKV